MAAYELYAYSDRQLLDILGHISASSATVVSEKLHCGYLTEYFQHIGAETILVESDYVDRDYLEDYAAYYARSFRNYGRKCTRIHFFKTLIEASVFDGILKGDTADVLRENYLGYIVVKPIPKTFIGKTCLLTYNDDVHRHFPISRQYDVHLFGIKLKVSTIAYQEQDSTVAACATSALWSMFQCTGLLFQHHIPSPVKISESATRLLPFASRHFPNKGLSAEQMAYAIREMGLEPYLINAESSSALLKINIAAYLSYGIPLLLGVDLIDVSTRASIGWHAVAVTGHKLDPADAVESIQGLSIAASAVSKIYAHDDQIGPFARMEFQTGTTELKTSWRNNGHEVVARPLIILIPLYHKIRIPFEKALSHTYELDWELKRVSGAGFVWDIKLVNVSKVKSEILSDTRLQSDHKKVLLTTIMPKYMWSIEALLSGLPVFNILLDATDLEQGNLFIGLVRYQDKEIIALKDVFVKALGAGALRNQTVESILRALQSDS